MGCAIFVGDEQACLPWTQALYRKLCHYSHARGDATSFGMWNSTGPAYSAEAFKESHHTFLEVHALCLILAKAGPTFLGARRDGAVGAPSR